MDGYSSGFDDCSEGGTDSSREDGIYEPSSDSKRSNGELQIGQIYAALWKWHFCLNVSRLGTLGV